MNTLSAQVQTRPLNISATFIFLLLMLLSSLAVANPGVPLQMTVSRGDTGGTVGPLNTVGDDLCPADPTNGCDFDPDDDLVRTNDGVGYVFSVAVDPPGDTVTLDTELKLGMVWDTLPPSCNPLTSTLTGDGITTRSHLVCDLGFRSAYAEDLTFVARALGSNMNGDTSGLHSAVFDGPNCDPIVGDLSGIKDVTITAAPRMNLRKTYRTRRAATVGGEVGMRIEYQYWIETWQHDTNGNNTDDPDPLLGNEMVTSPVTFTEDLSGISPNAYIISCDAAQNGSTPRALFDPTAPERSVLNNGSNACSATGPGATGSVVVTHTGADLSLSHYPTQTTGGAALPGDRRIAAFGRINIFVPQSDFEDAGGSIPSTNTVKGFNPTSISGQDNFLGLDQNPADDGIDGTAEDKEDNQVSITLVEGGDGWSHTYRCSQRNVTPWPWCTATNSAGPNAAWWDAPTTASAVWGGDGPVEPQQNFGSYTYFRNGGFGEQTGVETCAVYDSSLYEVVDITPGVGARCNGYCGTLGTDYVIEYGVGYANATWPPPTGAATGTETEAECQTDASNWFTTTTAAKAVGPITKARLRMLRPLPSGSAVAWSANLQALPDTGDPSGTLLETWASYKTNEKQPDWRDCNYNSGDWPAPAHTPNACGDRLYLTRSLARIEKKTVPSDLVNTMNAGGTVIFELFPSFTSISGATSDVVDIVDILPAGLEYVPNSATQAGVLFEPTVTGNIATGQTLTWPLGTIQANTPIDSIRLTVQTPLTTPNGTAFNNTGRIDAPKDISSPEQRSDVRPVTIIAPVSMLMAKKVDNVLVDRDTAFTYTVEYLNATTIDFNHMEIIDILPFNGDGRFPPSNFQGTYSVTGVSSPSTNHQFYFTKDAPAGMSSDPLDATQDFATGSVHWCPATAAGAVDPAAVPTIGGGSAACPQNGGEVTAVRLVDDQVLPQATIRDFTITLLPSGNAGGDQYTNQGQGSADGVTLRPKTPFVVTRVRENPVIGLAKSAASVVGNQVTYNFLIENLGDTPFAGLSLVDDLDATFGAGNYSIAAAPTVVTPPATGTIVPNANFTGSTGATGAVNNNDLIDTSATNSLPIGESAVMAVTVQIDTVTDQGNGLGVYDNSAVASGETPQGATTTDTSDDGTDTDTDDDGNPGGPGEDDPTQIALQPEIGLAKSVASATPVGNGTYDVTYNLIFENLGGIPLHDVQLTDDLTGTFGTPQAALADVDMPGEYFIQTAPSIVVNAADPFTALASFTGAAPDTGMLDIPAGGSLAVGESVTVSFTLRFFPDMANEPFLNSAVISGDTVDDDDTDNTDGVDDTSDDGTDPDADGDGNPDEDGENDPTPLRLPLIGVAKDLTSVVELSANVFRVTFSILVENHSAVEPATNIQLVEDLTTTFMAPVTFSNIVLNSATLTPNPAYDGSSDTDMLDGTDNLPINGSATMTLTVDVSTGGDNGPFTNQITMTTADTPGGPPTSSDLSDDGTNTDSNGDGNAGGADEDDPTVFQLPPQEIGLAKQITSATQVGPTTYEINYSLVVENLSADTAATNVQVTDNLTTTFPGVTSITVTTAPAVSGDLTAANAGFDGSADTNLLAGNENLAVGESATITFQVTVDFGTAIGNAPFNNSATASTSNTPGGSPIVTDNSDDGTDPDGTNPGSPNDEGTEDDPTPFTPMPQSIGIAKDLATVVEVTSGVFDVTFNLLVSNLSSTVDATNVQIVEDFNTTFAGATSFAVQSVNPNTLTANAAFDGDADTNLLAGTDTLAIGGSETVVVVVRVDTGGNLGPYSNQVTATTAATPGGPPTSSDDSDDGTNPDADNDGDGGGPDEDDPTVFQLPPQEVSLAKQATNVNQIGLTTYTVDYSLVLANTSATETATNVQITDDLTLTFAGTAGFSISQAPVVTGALTAANAAFDGQTDLNLLAGNENLPVGGQATITFQVTVDVGTQPGPFLNSATASASNTPGGPPIVTDTSDDGNDPNSDNPGAPGDMGTTDDPTPVYIDPQAIGIAKDLRDVVEIGPTVFDVTFDLVVSNLSATQPASNIQVVEDLAATFTGTASWTLSSVVVGPLLTQNPAYTGSGANNLLAGADTLAVGDSETITLIIRVDTGGFNGPFTNQASVTTSDTPGGPPVAEDLSDAGSNPDSDNDGDGSGPGEDDPNVFQLPPQEVGIAKSISGFTNIGGSEYEVTFALVVANLSASEVATNVQVTDDLAATFAGVANYYVQAGSVSAGALTPNTSYDGIVDLNLLAGSDSLAVGQSETISFTVVVDFTGGTGPFLNQATATVANSPGGTPINSDNSDSGTDPDGDNPGAPGDNGSSDDPTPISIPKLELTKVASEPVHVGGYIWDATYTLLATNTGTIPLTNVQITDDLASYLSPSQILSVSNIVATGFTGGAANSGFNGSTDQNLLSGTPQLGLGQSGQVMFTVRFDVSGGVPGAPNTAYAGSPELDEPVPSDDPTETPGDGDDTSPTPLLIPGDEDGDGAPDNIESDTADRDGDGIPDSQDYDPMGYFYCEDNGEILSGGFLEVQGPLGSQSGIGTSNGISIVQDGSGGFYQFFVTEPGTYTMQLTYPPQGIPSTLRLPDPAPFDAIAATTNPVILGSSEVGSTGVLADFSAPTNTPYHMSFTMGPGASVILLNNIPLTGCAGDAGSIVLGKASNTERVITGDFASYTLTLRNTEDFLLQNVTVQDMLPPGFTYVVDSAQILRAGVASPIAVTGSRPIEFNVGNLAANEEIEITYLLRVGAGVVSGQYTNTAQALIDGDPGSNSATANVEVVDDPLLNKTRVIGKVWHDRDGDAWQDSAHATDVTLSGGPWPDAYVVSELMPGRITEEDALDRDSVTLRMERNWAADEIVTLTTGEGTVLRLHKDGTIEPDHKGKKKRGYTAQNIVVDISGQQDALEDYYIRISNQGVSEEGLAGVRLATVEGYVIETDQYGRYHIEDIGNVAFDIGSNYIVKVDTDTLPEGTEFTTENPRVERLTQSLMSDIDFGVQLPALAPAEFACVETPAPVVAEAPTQYSSSLLSTIYFESGSAVISQEQLDNIQKGYAKLWGKRDLKLRFTGHTDDQRLSARAQKKFGDNLGLSKARAQRVSEEVAFSLGIESQTLVTEGKGFNEPVASNETPTGMARNRRVVVEAIWDETPLAKGPVEIAASSCAKDTPVAIGSRRVRTRVTEVRFESGQHDVSAEQAENVKEKLGEVMDESNLTVRVVGHADTQRLSANAKRRYEDNQDLSEARAKEVAGVIEDGLGIPAEAIETAGHGDRDPVASNDTPEGMAANRRAEIDVAYDKEEMVTPTVVDEISQGPASYGVMRVIEDQAVNEPRLAVVSEFESLRADAESVSFHAYSNYPAYIERYELSIYAGNDNDRVRPLATLTDTPSNRFDVGAQFDWQPERAWSVGDNYQYVLRAYGAEGRVDETAPRKLYISDPNRVIASQAIAEEVIDSLEAAGPGSARTLATVFGQDHLERQSIAVDGGRVLISGRGIDGRYQALVADQAMLVDGNGQFALEVHLPKGEYKLGVALSDESGERMDRELDVLVDNKYLFMVGLANVTYGGNDISGAVEVLSGDDRFNDDTYTSGRVAFYLKGKIKGKYLITAQADTTEDDLSNLTDNLQRKDPTSIFRRLEPDQYYPVYGDDSTLKRDTDTQGAIYVRVDWDKSKALWGNFNTDMTQNEFAQYNRALYGAQLVWNSTDYTDHNDNRWHVNAFVSEPQTVSGHNEFLSTGGSLYYLNQTDVVQGSERIRVEVRRRDTLQVVENITLEPGKDYQFDHIQGRIILNRPLSMVVNDRFDNIIKDTPLEGDDVYLIADFEYQPIGFDAEDITAGVRAEGWVNDNIGLGLTHVDESRAGNDYSLSGADVTLKMGEGTYLKLEGATSESNQSNAFVSLNGGLDFAPQTQPGAATEGDAYGAELRVNLGEVTEDGEGVARAWHKVREAGFSSSRESSANVETIDTGFEADLTLSEPLRVLARGNVLEQEGQAEQTTLSLQGDYRLNDKWDAGLEARYQEQEFATPGNDSDALLVGARLRYQLNERSGIYGELQTAADSSGAYEDNDLLTLGWESRVTDRFGYLLEVADGDRGSALIGGIEYKMNENFVLDAKAGLGSNAYNRAGASLGFDNGYEIYGSYGDDPDGLMGVGGGGGRKQTTIGQRMNFGNGLQLYNEHQRSSGRFENGVTEIYGIDIGLTEALRMGMSLQQSDIETNGQSLQREAATVGMSFRSEDLRWGANLEYRRDESGINEYQQWLTTNSLEHKVNEGFRWLAKLNYSFTEDQLTGANAARFGEGSIGVAYRPTWHDRMNLLGRYTYLYDLVSPDQTLNRPDQRSHVVELESIYDLSRRWELGAKVAGRQGEIRANRDQGLWFDNGAMLGVLRARYHLVHKWDGLVEYRYLTTLEVDDVRQGWLLGIHRHLGDHFKVGVGYNFTDFSDDLTSQDYDFGGWFIDAVGKF